MTPRRVLVMATLAALAIIPNAACQRHPPRTHTVDIAEMRFTPSMLIVRPGDTVEWVNRDLVPHTVTSREAGLDSGPIAPDTSWRWTAVGPATMTYVCTLHPTMSARLDVK